MTLHPWNARGERVGQVATALGAPAPVVTIANEARLLRELQGEIQTARDGQRDAMWSIARAVAEAREYVFVESPMFGRTARPDATHPETGLVDLATLLATRMTNNPRLKVIICVPRFPDFPVEQENWFRAATPKMYSTKPPVAGGTACPAPRRRGRHDRPCLPEERG